MFVGTILHQHAGFGPDKGRLWIQWIDNEPPARADSLLISSSGRATSISFFLRLLSVVIINQSVRCRVKGDFTSCAHGTEKFTLYFNRVTL